MLSVHRIIFLLLMFIVLVNSSVPNKTTSTLPYILRISHTLSVCTGSLVSSRFVLTSADCVVFFFQLDKVRVTRTVGSTAVYYTVFAIHRHPSYNIDEADNVLNDLALLELNEDVGDVTPVEILEDEVRSESKITMVAWEGRKLKATAGETYASSDCTDVYTYTRNFKADQICAGRLISCSWHESRGAPLVYQDRLLGLLTEYPEPLDDCDVEWTAPSIYTRVAAHKEWIRKVLKGKEQNGGCGWVFYLKILTVVFLLGLNAFMVWYLVRKCRENRQN